MTSMDVTTMNDRRKKVELLSTVGAGLLGAGIALLLRRFLEAFAVAILGVGLAMHGWGMYSNRLLENATKIRPARWQEILYWSCWVALLTLVVYIILPWL